MSIDPKGGKEPLGSQLANCRGQLAAGVQRRLQAAIGEPEVSPPIEAEDFRGFPGLGSPLLQRAKGGRLAAGQVEDANALAFRLEFANSAGHAEFGVVGVGGNNQDVQHRIPFAWIASIVASSSS
jgi:hypothetical protein